MEISEKALDVVNDLIKINNDRVAGFEKAGADLEVDDENLIAIFNKLAGESEQYVIELTDIAQQYGGEVAEGTSTSGDLHRAWIDIKATFTGNDLLAILNECERGEDAAKSAYHDALDPENELSPELVQVLQIQQQGITEGHDLIKSLRDQAENADDNDDQSDENTVASSEPAYQEQQEQLTEQPTYEGAAGEYNQPTVYTPDPDVIRQQASWENKQEFPAGATNEEIARIDGESVHQDEAIPAEPSYENTIGEYRQQAEYMAEPETTEQEEAWEEDQSASTGNSKLMEFFIDELKDLLWAERELVDTLPDMAEAATSQELKTAFTNHLAETEEHVNRLEQIFGILGLEPETTKCDAMSGIVDEGDEIISNTEEGTAQRDVGLIFAGQKAEHYEIASYGGMVSLAKTLGYYDIAEMLVLTLDEEKTADALLTEIAENHVNYEASTEQSDD